MAQPVLLDSFVDVIAVPREFADVVGRLVLSAARGAAIGFAFQQNNLVPYLFFDPIFCTARSSPPTLRMIKARMTTVSAVRQSPEPTAAPTAATTRIEAAA